MRSRMSRHRSFAARRSASMPRARRRASRGASAAGLPTRPVYTEAVAKLRHIAVVVQDLERAARFYESVFELERVGEEHIDMGSAIYLSDGVINLALLKYKGEAGSGLKNAEGFVGAHHFGFQVEDLEEAKQRVEAAGGKFFFTLGKSKEEANFEVKYKDPDGVIFDLSEKGWLGTSK